MNGLSTIDFIADEMYQADCRKRNSIGSRWLCLREEVAKKYLKRAQRVYDRWTVDEQTAQSLRAARNPRAFFGSAPETTGESK